MKSKINLFATAVVLFTVLTLVSCKKEGSSNASVNEQEVLTMSEENTNADAGYDDIAEIGLSAGADMEASGSINNEVPGTAAGGGLGIDPARFENLAFKLGPCAIIDVTPNDSTFPKTITINYGEGCVCKDGKFRKGIVTLHFSAPIRQSGAVLTISLTDYYVNRAHIEGTKTITNLSASAVHKYSTVVEDGKVTWPNGRGFKYEGEKTITQLSGMDTRTVRDDVYSIEGRNKTSYANGIVVVKNTETPLIKPIACEWIVKGLLKIRINDRTMFIDFGNGDCDNKALLKWANGEKIITLP